MAKINNLLETFISVGEFYERENRDHAHTWVIYLIEKSLYHKVTQKMDVAKARFLAKANIDSVSYHVITNSTRTVVPVFKNLEQLEYKGIRWAL